MTVEAALGIFRSFKKALNVNVESIVENQRQLVKVRKHKLG